MSLHEPPLTQWSPYMQLSKSWTVHCSISIMCSSKDKYVVTILVFWLLFTRDSTNLRMISPGTFELSFTERHIKAEACSWLWCWVIAPSLHLLCNCSIITPSLFWISDWKDASLIFSFQWQILASKGRGFFAIGAMRAVCLISLSVSVSLSPSFSLSWSIAHFPLNCSYFLIHL